MNIFILSRDPALAAQYQCYKHVVKMCLEAAQILCAAYDNAPYKKTHLGHPCTVWALASTRNYLWLVRHGFALCSEYEYRYGKRHKSETVIEWCVENYSQLKFNSNERTPFAQAMPEQYKCNDAVTAYRDYYFGEKRRFAKWTKRRIPSWWTDKTRRAGFAEPADAKVSTAFTTNLPLPNGKILKYSV